MKVETPKDFESWFAQYEARANYFMAIKVDDKDQNHALWLCMRDAFIAGQDTEKAGE